MAEAVVEYDYDAEQDDELTLRVGDVIKNVVTTDGGWWEGELKGKKGVFPDNFVKLKVKDSVPKKEEKREATQRKSVKELANKFKDGVPVSATLSNTPQKKKDTPKMKKCKVMFDYKPENEDELELIIGQIIDVTREVEEGWWEGTVNGKTGVFPSNFVVVENGEGGDQHTANGSSSKPLIGSTTGESGEDSSQIRGKKVVGVGLGNIFQGGPIKLRNTIKGDPPKPKADDKDTRDLRQSSANTTDASKREKPVERAIVRYSYTAEQPDELSLKEGEVIRVLDKHLEDDGWWKGEVSGKVGVFPDNFVELLPTHDEPSKVPKKPPPPTGKNLYPKLPDKTAEEKNTGVRKDHGHRKSNLTKRRMAVEEAAADKSPHPVTATANAAPLKKTPAPPPIGRKPPGLAAKPGSEAASASGKADPPSRPSEPRGSRELGSNHLHSSSPPPASSSCSQNSRTEDGEEASFDAVEASSHKLVHLTASRAKGPKKRPPSTVNTSAEVEKLDTIEEPVKGNNHVSHTQPEKLPLPTTNKDHSHILQSSEPERGLYNHRQPPVSSHDNTHNSSRERNQDSARQAHQHHGLPHPTSTPPPRPPEPSRHMGQDSAALMRLVEDLQREVRDLRSTTVSRNEYNDLRSDYLRLRQEFEAFRTAHAKKIRDLMLEVDEEKKLRLNTQVEVERCSQQLKRKPDIVES